MALYSLLGVFCFDRVLCITDRRCILSFSSYPLQPSLAELTSATRVVEAHLHLDDQRQRRGHTDVASFRSQNMQMA
jgi:hypothetical protein